MPRYAVALASLHDNEMQIYFIEADSPPKALKKAATQNNADWEFENSSTTLEDVIQELFDGDILAGVKEIE